VSNYKILFFKYLEPILRLRTSRDKNFSRMSIEFATTLLGRKPVVDLGFVLAHEHLHMKFDCSFNPSPHTNLPSDLRLKSMTNAEGAMLRQFPYHFHDNLNFTDTDAVLESLHNYQELGGGTLVEVSTIGLHRQDINLAKI
jgi:predicted metal-dependent phosphotriesterase family hydrolase